MKNIIISFSIFILLFYISDSLSQEKGSYSKTGQDTSINKYDKGVQFYIVNGASFAFKTRKTYPNTWRLLFDLSGGIIKKSSTTTYAYIDSTGIEYENEDNRTEIYFAFSFQYNYFFHSNRYFDPYIGIGPLFIYERNSYEYTREEIDINNPEQSNKIIVTNHSLGFIAVGGVESEVLKHLSLFLEYNLNVRYNWEDYDSGSTNFVSSFSRKGKWTSLELSGVKIGVVVYF